MATTSIVIDKHVTFVLTFTIIAYLLGLFYTINGASATASGDHTLCPLIEACGNVQIVVSGQKIGQRPRHENILYKIQMYEQV